jgi:hypothetical protein
MKKGMKLLSGEVILVSPFAHAHVIHDGLSVSLLSGFFHPFLGLLAGESSSDSLIVGVMEAEIDSDVDAHTIAKQGVKVIQLHTGGMCHLDADMTAQGLEGLQADELDLVILENVGNPKPALLIPIGDE